MKPHSKIFIGMALGVVLGMVFGHRSPWLDHTTVALDNLENLVLMRSPGGQPLGVRLKGGRSGHAVILADILETSQRDRKRFYRIAFSIDGRLALQNPGSRLKVGDRVVGWVDSRSVPRPLNGAAWRWTSLLTPVGMIFLRLIRMVIVPLVFASLLVSMAAGDSRGLGRIGTKTIAIFVVSTILAISIGLTMANVLRPGDYVSAVDREQLDLHVSNAANANIIERSDEVNVIDNILSMIPENPIQALAQGEMLPTIFFALFFGFALTRIDPPQRQAVVSFFEATNTAMVKIVEIIIKLAPYGVFALVAKLVSESGIGILKALFAYMLVSVGAMVLHVLAIQTASVRGFSDISAKQFFQAIRPAHVLAFSTSSSTATLPVTMACAEKGLGVSARIASFVLPMGSTVNMDGTAIYQGVATVFIAQVFGVDLSLGDQLSIVVTATLASIGTAGVPGVGIVTLALVLTTVGIPTAGIALILGVDRILDMFRTVVNITGDVCAAVIVAATEGERIRCVRETR